MVMSAAVPATDLFSKRLIFVLGKGGVGRTTMSAALGLLLARRGKRVLLFQSSTKERLGALFGKPVGEEVTFIRENLWAVNTNPQAALHEYGLMVLKWETVYKMVFENRFAKALVRAIPGVDDYAVLGKAWFHTTEMQGDRPRFDTVVFDGPATGHSITMLRIPTAILTAVPEGPLTRDAARARDLLTDRERTAAVLVTLAEEMPANETVELVARLRKEIGMHPSHLIINALYPERFKDGSAPGRVLTALLGAGGAADDPELAPLLGRGRIARARRKLNDTYLARLVQDVPLPTAKVPSLFVPILGPREVEAIADTLEKQL